MKKLIIDSSVPNLRKLIESKSQYLVYNQGTSIIPAWLNLNTILNPYHIISLYQIRHPNAQIMIIDKINKALPQTIHIEEYLTLYPFLVPTSKLKIDQTTIDDLMFSLKQRNFKVTLDEPSQVSAVFVVDPADQWETKCQILCDLATTSDGSIGSTLKASDSQIPYYWASKTSLLYLSFEVCYKLLYGEQPKNQIQIDDLLVSYADLSDHGVEYMGSLKYDHPKIVKIEII